MGINKRIPLLVRIYSLSPLELKPRRLEEDMCIVRHLKRNTNRETILSYSGIFQGCKMCKKWIHEGCGS